jgi:hypothetical protein
MTDTTSRKLTELAGLTFEDIQKFLQERVKNHACPACAHNDWRLVGDTEHFTSYIGIPRSGDFPLPPPSIPVAAIACSNCGYIRSHALTLIALWKEAQKNGS